MNTADIIREEMHFYVRAALFAPRCLGCRLMPGLLTQDWLSLLIYKLITPDPAQNVPD